MPSTARRALSGLALLLTLVLLGMPQVHATTVDQHLLNILVNRTSDNEFVVEAHPLVEEQLQSLVGTSGGRASMARALDGLAEYSDLVYGALESANLPPQLAAIPIVESGYQNIRQAPGSMPEASLAAGLWQFIPGTARAYGLRVDGEVDQRLNPGAQTRAAAKMLSDLYRAHGDWGLALAAYNVGSTRVHKAVAQGGTRDVFVLMDQGLLNHYTARVMAAAVVMENPEALGLR